MTAREMFEELGYMYSEFKTDDGLCCIEYIKDFDKWHKVGISFDVEHNGIETWEDY